MTDLQALNRGDCPECGSQHFHPGPRGGASRNVMCAICGAKFNYCAPLPPQRIDNETVFYNQGAIATLAEIRRATACSCRFSDAWRCAVDQRLSTVSCHCVCHR